MRTRSKPKHCLVETWISGCTLCGMVFVCGVYVWCVCVCMWMVCACFCKNQLIYLTYDLSLYGIHGHFEVKFRQVVLSNSSNVLCNVQN